MCITDNKNYKKHYCLNKILSNVECHVGCVISQILQLKLILFFTVYVLPKDTEIVTLSLGRTVDLE